MRSNDRKTAIVTGAAGGIGGFLVRAALDAGYQEGALDKDEGRLKGLLEGLTAEGRGDSVFSCHLDIADELACNRAVDDVVGRFGRLDSLNNAAGIGMVVVRDDHMVEPIRFDEVTSDQWDLFFNINAKGPFLMAKAALPHLTVNGWGRVVNVTTSMDTMYKAGFCPYGPSKAALEANTAIWARELLGSGVTVNVLTPGGPTDTAMLGKKLPFSRSSMIQPEVMQAPLKWLLSTDSDDVTGRRFIGRFWDPKKTPAESAEVAGGPAAWPGAGKPGVWPADT